MSIVIVPRNKRHEFLLELRLNHLHFQLPSPVVNLVARLILRRQNQLDIPEISFI